MWNHLGWVRISAHEGGDESENSKFEAGEEHFEFEDEGKVLKRMKEWRWLRSGRGRGGVGEAVKGHAGCCSLRLARSELLEASKQNSRPVSSSASIPNCLARHRHPARAFPLPCRIFTLFFPKNRILGFHFRTLALNSLKSDNRHDAVVVL